MSALASTVFAASLVLIAPSEKCVPAPAEKAAAWDGDESLRLSRALAVLSRLTCESFVVPSSIGDHVVQLDGASTKRTPAATRRWLFGLLAKQGVRLRDERTTRVLGDPEGAESGLTNAVGSIPRGMSDGEWERGIRCREKGCEIDRVLFDKLLADTTALATSARFVPSIKEGKPNGFKLYAIRPDSFFSRMGFQNGDTITTINGEDMNTPDRALELYAKLREATHLSVRVERRGEVATMEYVIK